MSVSGKNILVTGASGALGSAVVESFCADGANISIITSQEIKAHRINEKYGDSVRTYLCDLRDEKKIEDTCKEILQENSIDIIINIAGIDIAGNIDELNSTDFYDIFNVNFFGVYRIIKNILPSMKEKRKGVILNIASTLGSRAVPNCIAYSTSKAAIIHFSKCLAIEVAPWMIRVNCISPGYFVSNMNQESLSGSKGKNFINEKIPLRRLLKVEEILPFIRLIISDAGSYMTGSNVVIDGGLNNW